MSWLFAVIATVLSGGYTLANLPDPAQQVYGSFGGIGVAITWGFAMVLSAPALFALPLNLRSWPEDGASGWRFVEVVLVVSPPLLVSLVFLLRY